MYYYPERQLIYIRVPRTGSTSFISALGGQPGMIGQIHGNAIEAKNIISPVIWDWYKKIGFVRYPIDWAANIFTSHRTGSAKINKLKAKKPTFTEFIRDIPETPYSWLCDKDGKLLVDEVLRMEDLKQVFKQYEVPFRHINKSPQSDLRIKWSDRELSRITFKREYEHYKETER